MKKKTLKIFKRNKVKLRQITHHKIELGVNNSRKSPEKWDSGLKIRLNKLSYSVDHTNELTDHHTLNDYGPVHPGHYIWISCSVECAVFGAAVNKVINWRWQLLKEVPPSSPVTLNSLSPCTDIFVRPKYRSDYWKSWDQLLYGGWTFNPLEKSRIKARL